MTTGKLLAAQLRAILDGEAAALAAATDLPLVLRAHSGNARATTSPLYRYLATAPVAIIGSTYVDKVPALFLSATVAAWAQYVPALARRHADGPVASFTAPTAAERVRRLPPESGTGAWTATLHPVPAAGRGRPADAATLAAFTAAVTAAGGRFARDPRPSGTLTHIPLRLPDSEEAVLAVAGFPAVRTLAEEARIGFRMGSCRRTELA